MEVAQATTLTVETTGSTDTFGTLFDADEESLETNADGGSGTNFLIGWAVEPGTHYVEVRGYNDSSTGAYELRVSATDGGGGTAPDLVVESPSVDDDTPDAGASFTFRATVRNQGDGQSAASTLNYYRSSNSTIFTTDTEVGTDSVGVLAASATSAQSITLTAPSSAGAYYYGACVDSVTGESSTSNNCSDGVKVDVAGTDSYCRDDDVLNPGNSCDIYNTNIDFSVNSSGLGCLLAPGIRLCQGADYSHQNRTLNGERYSLEATRDGNSWEIEEVDPAPPD